jgi:ribosomal protein S7
MPRRREVPKRDILPDPKFGNVEVSKFVNTIMKSGKKSVAERIVYGAFDQIVTKTGKDPWRFLVWLLVTSSRWSKSRVAALVGLIIRCRLKFVLAAGWPCHALAAGVGA